MPGEIIHIDIKTLGRIEGIRHRITGNRIGHSAPRSRKAGGDNLILQRRVRGARAMFECLLALRNDVGLLAEEYDPRTRCQMGNFPQAFSHVALVNTAYNFTRSEGPAEVRAGWGTQMIVQAARKSVPFNRRLLLAIHVQARCQPN